MIGNLRKEGHYVIIIVYILERSYMIFLNFIILSTLVVPLIVIIGGIRRVNSPQKNYTRAVVTNLVVVTGIFIVDRIRGGLIAEDLRNSIDEMIGAFDAAGAENIGGISLDQLSESFNQMVEMVMLVMPASLIIWTVVIAFVEYKISFKICTRQGKNPSVQDIVAIKDFTLQRDFFIGMVVIFILSLVLNLTFGDFGSMVYLNVSMVMQFFFSIQGLAVVVTFLTAKRVPSPLGIFLGILIYFLPYGSAILMILGILEVFLKLRRRIYLG